MSPYQRLLLIADPSRHGQGALLRAGALAEASGAALHIMTHAKPQVGLSLLDPDLRDQTRGSVMQEHRDWLEDKVGLLRCQGVAVTSEAIWTDSPLEEILGHVADRRPDLLLKDVQHEPALKRVFATPLDWQLLRECPVPVHLVGQAAHALPRKVLAAVDPSQPNTQIAGLNERIIRLAHELAVQCSAELHLLHAYDLTRAHLSGLGEHISWHADFIDELKNRLSMAFNALAEQQGVPAERRHFIKGPPSWAVADFAEQTRMDVVVMGAAHRRGLKKLLGGTTEQTLNQLSSSVLVVKA